MKIQTTIKKEEHVEKEITLPYYCKDDLYYYKVLDEEKVQRVLEGGAANMNIGISPLWLNISEVARAKEITEEEFNAAANRVLFIVTSGIPVPEIDFGGQQE